MKNLKCIGVGSLAMVLLAYATGGRANTLAYTVTGSIPPTQANWSSPLAIQQFQSNLGTLQSVTLTLNGSISTTLTAGNITNLIPPSQSSSGSASTVGQFSLQDSSGSLSGTPQLTFMSPIEPYSFSAGGSQSWSLSSTGASGATYTAPFILSEFTGSGNITLTASGSAFTNQINTGGASYAVQSTISGAVVDVTYTYSASVPEPSTFGLAGSAIAAAVVFRSRRRRRVEHGIR